MIIKMRNGNVAIEQLAADERSSGGIYIPTTAIKIGNLRMGRIVETGPGELVQGQFVAMDINKGDEVIFDISRSEALEVEGKKLVICNMVDIIATISAKHLSVVPKSPVSDETA